MPKSIRKFTVQLTTEEAELLRRPIEGEGGFQSLLRDLQANLKPDNTMTIPAYRIEPINRYAHEYGGGGFQQRLLEGVLSALRRAGVDPSSP